MELFPRKTLLALGLAGALNASEAAQARPAETMQPVQAEKCENVYATATDGKALAGYNVNIVSPTSIRVESNLPDMRSVRPDCRKADVTRYLGMQTYLGKQLVGGKDLMKGVADRGREASANISTSRKLACGRRVTAKAYVHADSPLSDGIATETRRTSFTVRCSK